MEQDSRLVGKLATYNSGSADEIGGRAARVAADDFGRLEGDACPHQEMLRLSYRPTPHS